MGKNKKYFALILAGGRSRRMGSDKALIEVAGKTLLERAVLFWKSSGLVSRVLIAAGTPEHLRFLGSLPEGTKPVFDQFKDCGPMSGILSAFRQTEAEILCVSAVDMPCLKREAAALLLNYAEESIKDGEGCREAGRKPDAAVFIRDGRPEPLFGVYRRSAADAAERLLRSGRRKMSELLKEVETVYCRVPDDMEDIFQNINTPEDFHQFTIVCGSREKNTGNGKKKN